jgi:pSer/pThr/pTyr-binding forkhead associated (FHA) protein
MTDSRTSKRKVIPRPFGAPHVHALAVTRGEDVSAIHRVCAAETVIGRADDCDFTLEDTQISNRHCQLRVDGPICTIRDLGSTNGTVVNGRELRDGVAHRLRHMDEIEVGSTRLLVIVGRFRPEGDGPRR